MSGPNQISISTKIQISISTKFQLISLRVASASAPVPCLITITASDEVPPECNEICPRNGFGCSGYGFGVQHVMVSMHLSKHARATGMTHSLLYMQSNQLRSLAVVLLEAETGVLR